MPQLSGMLMIHIVLSHNIITCMCCHYIQESSLIHGPVLFSVARRMWRAWWYLSLRVWRQG